MKIIAVDDKEENRYLLKALFEGTGDEVVTATNGREALDILRTQKIDLIISDCLMPVMDGFELCRQCKADETLKNIPFVFCTASYPERKDEEFATELGAAEYIIKPVAPPVLLQTIQKVMERAKKGQTSKAKSTLADNELFQLYNERLVNKLDQKVAELELEIKQRKEAENNTNRLHNIILTVRQINQFIVEIEDENELLQKACAALADSRSYKLARIGFIQEGNYDIQPVAQAGFAQDYLKSLKVTWDDSEYGSNPSGMAIKTGKPVVIGILTPTKISASGAI